MMSIPITLAISVLFCISTAKAEFKTLFSREETHPNTEDIYGLTSLKNATLTYKICKNTESKAFTKCKIFQEILGRENKQSRFCEVTLHGEIDDKYVYVVAFGTDKAVVGWYDEAEEKEYFVKYTIVHFSDCATAEVKVSFQSSEDRFLSLAYNLDVILPKDEHTFDVVFENSTVCAEKVCRATFDDRGNLINGPVAWFTALENSYIYIYPNLINGAYLVNEGVPFEDSRISLLKPDGLQILKEFNHTYVDEAIEYGSIRICYIANESTVVDCELFDSNGKFNLKTSVDFNRAIEGVDVYNTHDGGFIIMLSNKPSDSGFHFYLIKVAANGNRFGPIEVPNFECKAITDEKHSYLFENKITEYCATRVCYTGEKYNVLSKCFTADDLIAITP